ncbi:MAG: formylglycine-generating enzyme family protein [Planctomycetota bacterium]|nr:MAG: formylglycine-generating enzyme family protein [Planctomycetota bacterium]
MSVFASPSPDSQPESRLSPGLLIVALLVFVGGGAVVTLWPTGKSPGDHSASSLIVDAPAAAPLGMVWVPGGQFMMGTNASPLEGPENPDRVKPDENPAHAVELDGYWMDAAEVTNRQFAEFVAMTGYVTFSEKKPTREEMARSGLDGALFQEKDLVPGSLCYNPEFDRSTLDRSVCAWEYQVWKFVPGANWRQPEGPESSLVDRMDHPVVHVNWEDAVAYLDWAGKRLPTEAEFEFASRNGGERMRYPWGENLSPNGTYLCNYYQGEFPVAPEVLDGFEGSSPVKAFPPNRLGLYDISGNVWEWCHDYYGADYYAVSPRRNPRGPQFSHDPMEPHIIKRIIRGGSFMCNTNSCTGYRTGARMKGEFTSGTFHTGFRGVVDPAGRSVYEERQAAIAAWRGPPAPVP